MGQLASKLLLAWDDIKVGCLHEMDPRKVTATNRRVVKK